MKTAEARDAREHSTEAISTWLVEYLAKILDVSPSDIDRGTPFGEYGLDSAGAAGLSADLGQWLGTSVKESAAFDYPTIHLLSEYLSQSRG